MRLILLAVILFAPALVRCRQLCNTANNICETIPDDLNREALKEISNWWTEISEKRLLKCATGKPTSKDDDLRKSQMPTELLFQSFSCGDNQPFGGRAVYSFKGRIENFKFEGPGKFKIGEIDAEGHTHGTCFKIGILGSRNISSIVGNFVDGKLHGTAKLELEGGAQHICSFHHGQRQGLYRHWNANGTLTEVGRMRDDMRTGGVWRAQVNDSSAVLYAMTTVGRENSNSSMALAVVNSFGLALAGDAPFSILQSARYAKIESISVEDCFLTPKFRQVEGEAFKYNTDTSELRYRAGEPEPCPFCPQSDDWNEANVDGAVKAWLRQLSARSHDGMWQAEPSQEPLGDDALRIVDDIRHEKGDNFTCRVLGSKDRSTFIARRFYAEGGENSLNGRVSLEFYDAIGGNLPKIPLVDTSFYSLEGVMTNGVLDGTVVIALHDGGKAVTFLSAKVRDNTMHGLAVKFPITPLFPLAAEYGPVAALPSQEGVGVVASFRSGRPEGPVWLGTIGGGFLYGVLDADRKFTGDSMAFVYPDSESAFLGRFEDRVMKSARKARVVGEKCGEDGVKLLRFSEPEEGPIVFYSPPTNVSYGEGPQMADPYEERHVRLGTSAVPGGGEGVFAIRDLVPHQLACVYVGFTYRNLQEEQIYKEKYTLNESRTDEERRWATKYSINSQVNNARVEIPIEMDLPGMWMPSTAQKINCDFAGRRENAYFDMFEHPRYGLIMAAFVKRAVKAGEELFDDYGYKPSKFPYDFLWYHEEKQRYLDGLKEKELVEARKEEKKKKKLKKKKKKEGKTKEKPE